MEISLAPWRYRNILETDGGPVSRISVRETGSNFLGRKFEAFAYLSDSLRAGTNPMATIYGSPDGTGSSHSRSLSIYKAVSEAIERWAFHQSFHSHDSARYGFAQNPTTTGMAALPGFRSRASRPIALREAMERWAVCSWWEGGLGARLLPSPAKHTAAILLTTPWAKHAVVVTLGRSLTDAFVYSFACEQSPHRAIEKARIELERNIEVLDRFNSTNAPQPSEVLDTFEKRLLFFSTREGHALFDEHLKRSLEFSRSTPAPRLIVDQEIPGPWSRYASIWRCLFERDESEALSSKTDYFLF